MRVTRFLSAFRFFVDAAIQQLLDLMLSLNEANYSGIVEIRFYGGNFCVSSSTNGEFVLPAADTSFGNCQVLEYSRENDTENYQQLQKLVKEINSDANNSFRVQVIPPERLSPISSYPNVESTLTAGEWNRVAQENNRVEFVFR